MKCGFDTGARLPIIAANGFVFKENEKVTATEDRRVITGMEQQMAFRNETLGHGAKPIGWKVGFGAPAAMERLKLEAPLIGFLVDTLRIDNGAQVNVSGWVKPALEPEIAVYIGKDLPDGLAQLSDTAGVIAALGPAIEVADLSGDINDPTAILSGNIFHRNVILGPTDTGRAGAKLDGMHAVVSMNGEKGDAVSDLEANTGKLIDLVFHVANALPRFGEHLREGDVIITGSVTPPIFANAGEELVYELAPFAPLRLKLVD